MHLVHSARYAVDLGAHVFPTAKYGLLHQQVVAAGLVAADRIAEPEPVPWDDMAVVHAPAYLDKVRLGTLSAAEQAQVELPRDPGVVEGFRLMCGGTVETARRAVADGLAVHLGGGLHHAFPAHGEGFCYFNDVALSIRLLQRESLISRAAVVDCDVHHGNGTAFIFGEDPSVFTLSIHQQHNYPLFKPRGSLDIGLPDGTGDRPYLAALEDAMPRVFDSCPDLVVYLAGADPYHDDQLGGLGLTQAGLRRRDRLVLQTCRLAGVPVAVTLAGGYARRLDDTVAIHLATVQEAVRLPS